MTIGIMSTMREEMSSLVMEVGTDDEAMEDSVAWVFSRGRILGA